MKYPLSKDEWKCVTVIVIMLTVVCTGLGLIMNEITGQDIWMPLAGFLWLIFLYFQIIAPIIRRI